MGMNGCWIVFNRRGTKSAILLAGVCCFNWCATLSAADPDAANGKPNDPDFTALSFEDLGSIKLPSVYGASKHEQKTSEAPSSVSIVTQEDIKTYGYRTLGDLLRSVRGFYVTYDRAYNFTGLRGVNRPGDFGGRVLINIDGHRLNEPLYDSAFTHTEFLLDMDLVERVEIIRGPGSSLYGNNAFFAVINVITRRGADINGVEASTSAASYDTFTGRLSYGQKFQTNGVELLISGSYLDSAGHDRLHYPDFSAVNNGVAEGRDGSAAKSVYASLSYGEFALSAGYVDRQKDVPTAQYGAIFNDPRFRDQDVRGYAELKYTHTFANDWLVQARGYYDYYRFEAAIPFDYPPVTLNRDYLAARWVGSEVLASKTFWDCNLLTVGGEVRKDLLIDVQNFDVAPRVSYVNSQRDASSFAFYTQDELRVTTNLTLNAGIRYDHFSTFGDTVNPRAAIIYSPWHEGTFKFLYGQAFRAPNAFETDYIQPTYKSNPHLSSETIRSHSVVYEQSLPGNLRASGALYLNEIKGLIGQSLDPNDGLNFFDNLDAVNVRGFELELEGRWKHGLRSLVSYTYAEARDAATGLILNNSPRHLAKANLAVPLWREKIFLGLELQGMSSRITVRGNEVPSFWVANATLYCRELVKGLEFSASLYNLFDKTYSDPVSTDLVQDAVQQDGRTFRLKLTYKF